VIIGTHATGNLVEGNFLGTDITGTHALANAFDGISLSGAPRNTVGGTAPGAGNLISGNGIEGVRIVGVNATANLVQGNLIGTDLAGTNPLGNGADGVFIDNAHGNTIGGVSPSARNVIAANGGSGIQALRAGATGNLIAGNSIGTDASATLALGNRFDGVLLSGAPGNTVGGTTPGAGNVIAHNGYSGVDVEGRAASANLVQANLISANAAYGVLIQNARGNTIGGASPGAGNTITANAFGGIQILVRGVPVVRPKTAGNVIQGNQLAGNGRGPFRLGLTKTKAV
jgi:titin